MSKTFAHWLRAQTRRDDSIGDLARDVIEDVRSGCLSRITSPETLHQHVAAHEDNDAALEAIRSAGAEWRREGRKPVKATSTSTDERETRRAFSLWLAALAREGAELTAFELRCLLTVAAGMGCDPRESLSITPNVACRLAYDLGRLNLGRLPFDRLVETEWLAVSGPKDGPPRYSLQYGRTREDAVWAGARTETLNPK